MNNLSCCSGRCPKRATKTVSFLLSSVALIFMPKCPVCMAAYVALFTGLSVSTAAAGYLRLGLMVISLSVLAFLMLSGLRRLQPRR